MTQIDESPKYLTVDDLAKLLQVSKFTVYKWASEGKLPFIKLGYKVIRFNKDDISKWINSEQEEKK